MNHYSSIIPNNSNYMYRNSSSNFNSNSFPYNSYQNSTDDRFFLTPFLFGGLAGTALGYGIANNNQINRPPCCGWQQMPYYYPQQFPTFSNTNSFYY